MTCLLVSWQSSPSDNSGLASTQQCYSPPCLVSTSFIMRWLVGTGQWFRGVVEGRKMPTWWFELGTLIDNYICHKRSGRSAAQSFQGTQKKICHYWYKWNIFPTVDSAAKFSKTLSWKPHIYENKNFPPEMISWCGLFL